MPRIRVFHGVEIALGPGKADLLEAIRVVGTISGAAQRLDMSYMRAWTLLRTMNRCFRRPLVQTSRGGVVRGAARLTDTGLAALTLYRRMEDESRHSLAASWRALRKILRASPRSL